MGAPAHAAGAHIKLPTHRLKETSKHRKSKVILIWDVSRCNVRVALGREPTFYRRSPARRNTIVMYLHYAVQVYGARSLAGDSVALNPSAAKNLCYTF